MDTIQGTSSDIITSDELLLSNGHRILEYSYSDSEEVYELDQQKEEAEAETSISARSAKTDNWKLEWKNSIGNFIDGLQKYRFVSVLPQNGVFLNYLYIGGYLYLFFLYSYRSGTYRYLDFQKR